jgi:hypothetical protein
MNNSSSNIKIIDQFFNNNHFKMIFFILITIFLTYVINEQYYKNKKPYSYVVNVKINENKTIWWIGGGPGDELLYFFENKGYKNLLLNRNSGVSQNLGIKIFPTSKIDKDEYIKISKLLNEFKSEIINRSENKKEIAKKVIYDFIKENQGSKKKSMVISLALQKEILINITRKNKEFKYYIEQDLFYHLGDFDKDKFQRVNNNVMKKLFIAFILSIICILMFLWIKLFMREIKINQ